MGFCFMNELFNSLFSDSFLYAFILFQCLYEMSLSSSHGLIIISDHVEVECIFFSFIIFIWFQVCDSLIFFGLISSCFRMEAEKKAELESFLKVVPPVEFCCVYGSSLHPNNRDKVPFALLVSYSFWVLLLFFFRCIFCSFHFKM